MDSTFLRVWNIRTFKLAYNPFSTFPYSLLNFRTFHIRKSTLPWLARYKCTVVRVDQVGRIVRIDEEDDVEIDFDLKETQSPPRDSLQAWGVPGTHGEYRVLTVIRNGRAQVSTCGASPYCPNLRRRGTSIERRRSV